MTDDAQPFPRSSISQDVSHAFQMIGFDLEDPDQRRELQDALVWARDRAAKDRASEARRVATIWGIAASLIGACAGALVNFVLNSRQH